MALSQTGNLITLAESNLFNYNISSVFLFFYLFMYTFF